MNKQVWAGVLMAGLCQVVAASTVVTFEGAYAVGTKNSYCSGGVLCDSKDVPLDQTPFRLTFVLDFGTNMGGAPLTTFVRTVQDSTTGLSYESLSATQRHARWQTNSQADSQVPTIPLADSTSEVELPGGTIDSYNYALRSRSLNYWVNDFPSHQVSATAYQAWTLGSNISWFNSDGTGYQNRLALSSSALFDTTAENYTDLQSNDYFLRVLAGAINCDYCVSLSLTQDLTGPDGTGSTTQVFGRGHLVSVVNTSAVPEPSTYALMLAGLGVMGVALRRRRRG